MHLVNTELLITQNKTEENKKLIYPILEYIKNLFYKIYNYLYEKRYIIIQSKYFQFFIVILILCIIIKIFQYKYYQKDDLKNIN